MDMTQQGPTSETLRNIPRLPTLRAADIRRYGCFSLGFFGTLFVETSA